MYSIHSENVAPLPYKSNTITKHKPMAITHAYLLQIINVLEKINASFSRLIK